MLETATLRIRCVGSRLSFDWTDPGGIRLTRDREAHPDDLSAARRAFDFPDPSRVDLEAVGTRLYSRLWDREIRESVFGAPTCLLSLDVEDDGIPWEYTFGRGRFLADVHGCGRTATLGIPPARSGLRVLLVANPTGDLPYSATEAAEIEAVLRRSNRVRVTTLTEASATRDAILSALESEAFDILHFSCHAECAPDDPSAARFLVWDGALSTRDVSQAALAGQPVLCVANACESGKGPASLARAWQEAGVGSVVGSHWPVNNKASGFLCARFYESAAAGLPIGEALRASRAETRRVFVNDPLLSWAAFTLSGSPEFVLSTVTGSGPMGKAPFVGRDLEWNLLEEAWSAVRAGHCMVLCITGPPQSGKTRLAREWCATRAAGSVYETDGESESDESLAERLEITAKQCGGLVVFIDDAENRPELLRLLAGLSDQVPLLVLAVSESSQILEQIPREKARLIRLGPLDPEATRDLFQILGSTAPAEAVRLLPGEAERLALGLPDAGDTTALVNALADDRKRCLRVAAVLDAHSNVQALTHAMNLSEDQLWPILDYLCSRGWLVEASPGVFAFRRPDDRQAVLDGFTVRAELASLRLKAAEWCGNVGDYGQQGLHLVEANSFGDAALALRRAFDSCVDKGDTAGAVHWADALAQHGLEPADEAYRNSLSEACYLESLWTRARDLFNALPNLSPLNRARLADSCLRLGDLKDAEYHARLVPDTDVRAVALARAVRAAVMTARNNPREALVIAREALADGETLEERLIQVAGEAALMLGEAETTILLCESARTNSAKRLHARALQYSGEHTAAEKALRGLIEEQQRRPQPRERGDTLLALGELARDRGRLDEALTALEESLRIAEWRNEPAAIASALTLIASVHRRNGRFVDGLEAAERARDEAVRSNDLPSLVRANLLRATLHQEQGHLQTAGIIANEASILARNGGYGYGLAWALSVGASAILETDDPTPARELLEESLSVSLESHGLIGTANAWMYLGWLDWIKDGSSAGQFQSAVESASRISYEAVELPSRFGLALLNCDDDRSAALLKEIEALNMGPLAAWLRDKRGSLRVKQGRTEEALGDLASSYRVAARLGMAALALRSAEHLAGIYRSRGDRMVAVMEQSAAEWRDKIQADKPVCQDDH